MQPLPNGERVAIITNAGGPGIMAADAAESLGLKMVSPSQESDAKLRAFLPASAAFGNPIDVIGDADPDRYAKAFEVMQEDEKIDAIVVVVTPQNMTRPLELAEKLAAAHKGKKPVLAVVHGRHGSRRRQGKTDGRGHPELSVARPRHHRAAGDVRLRGVEAAPAAHRHALSRSIAAAWTASSTCKMRSGATQIGEVEAKEILRAYDFNVLGGQLARTGDEAVEIAERLGYPVVLKISSPDIIHKSDFGGVRINLANAEQVRDAFDLMMLRIQKRAPERASARRVTSRKWASAGAR